MIPAMKAGVQIAAIYKELIIWEVNHAKSAEKESGWMPILLKSTEKLKNKTLRKLVKIDRS